MPWFGLDIGGSLVKLVYFEPSDESVEANEPDNDAKTVYNISKYLLGAVAYGETGVRDQHLQLNQLRMNNRIGSLHFIRFPRSKMDVFLKMAHDKGFATFSSTVCATGGGAQMFAGKAKELLDVDFFKYDELISLIRGMEFIVDHSNEECYHYDKPHTLGEGADSPTVPDTSTTDASLRYPYLVVNIGSGVSILAVRSRDDYQRVSGTTIGGGTFQGLCSLLTGCATFEESIELASRGNNANVDKLVRDIYGGDYEMFGLSGHLVAASFGGVLEKSKRDSMSKEDLARAALVTVTNNVGSIARLCATSEKIERVIFVGNFLRVNPLSSRLLAYAMDYWSEGSLRALFMRHEGYCGAVGCLVELMQRSEARRMAKLNLQNGPTD